MNVLPTLEGGLRLEMENAMDWRMLEHIVVDAVGDGGKLPERLGALMDEASDWEEVVVPELRLLFSGQVAVVARILREARDDGGDDGEGGTGAVFITRDDAEAWYGALNQARLGLEARFRFGPSEIMAVEDLASFSEEKVGGFFRMRFYTRLQGLLLDFAME